MTLATEAAPAIGQPWKGGVYAGIARADEANPKDGHIVLLPDTPTTNLTWSDAVAWGEKLGDGARLPTRFESALLYANVRTEMDANRWHWTGTGYDERYAWLQHFDNGFQYDDRKSYEARARAVRRFDV